jgi:hypothetical protein
MSRKIDLAATPGAPHRHRDGTARPKQERRIG